MSGVLDTLGDLAHRAYNTVTGQTDAPSAPNKPGYTSTDASGHLGGISGRGAQLVSGRKAQLDKQIADAGG